ncbi:MAG: hypothetical protein ABI183_24495 [Polyangiaceae bacterium]
MFRRVTLALVIAASVIGCSLFVSLDGLNATSSDASNDGGDATTSGDANGDSTTAIDAGDASVDSGVIFVVDTCVADSADVVNLTNAGSIDWVHYGTSTDTDVKRVSPHVIGALVQSTHGQNPYGGDPRVFSWTDGTSFPAVGGTSNGQFDSNGPMVLSVNANPERRVLTLYLGTFSVKAHMTISMTPGLATSSQILQSDPDEPTQVRCVVHFASPVAAKLIMAYEIDEHLDAGGDYGNIAFISATLAADPN